MDNFEAERQFREGTDWSALEQQGARKKDEDTETMLGLLVVLSSLVFGYFWLVV